MILVVVILRYNEESARSIRVFPDLGAKEVKYLGLTLHVCLCIPKLALPLV